MECITRYLSEIAAAYIITVVIANGSIFNKIRQWMIDKTPFLQMPAMRGNLLPPHYLTCRLCLGLPISIIVALIYQDVWSFVVVYAVSYFMATQER